MVTIFQTAVVQMMSLTFTGWNRAQMGENQWKTTFREFCFLFIFK